MCSANAWHSRAAAATVARAGRAEDEAALRDALQLTRPGDDPGPAGRRLLAWRALAARSTGMWRQSFDAAAAILGVERDEGLQAAVEAAEACAAGHRLAPFAAARAYELARRALAPAAGRAGGGEGRANCSPSGSPIPCSPSKLKWPFVLPLLAGELLSAAGRRAAGDLGDGAETTRIMFGYARAAARACDLAAELGRRAEKLHEAAPKLRAKGARAALGALLDEDCLSAATRITGLSERGARRLFDRLVSLGAIRELTGRATFRLYGL